MSQISKLTKEQEELLPVYCDKWMKIGIKTGGIDHDEAKAAISEAYACAGLEPPDLWLYLESPYRAIIAQGLIQSIVDVNPDGLGLQERVNASVDDYISGKLKVSIKSGLICYGIHDAGWSSFYDYMWNVLKLDSVAPMSGLLRCNKTVGWWVPFDKLCIYTPPPTELHLDERGALHSLDGPACAYPDGWGVYAYHGIRVPEWVIKRPQDITPKKIKGESNAEIRRVMIARYGLDRWIVDGGFKPISTDMRGELYQDDEGRKVVKVICSTKGESYFLPVPPHVKTAEQAVSWTFGIDSDSYQPLIET